MKYRLIHTEDCSILKLTFYQRISPHYFKGLTYTVLQEQTEATVVAQR